MSQKLKEQIDRMVEESIRKILPQVMNEILVKTIANAGVIKEQRAPVPVTARPQPKRTAPVRTSRPSSLDQILDPEVGADFYQDPRAAMTEAMRIEDSPPPSNQVIAQRIQNLPPELQHLAEGMDIDDDGGEMWEDEMGDSAVPVATNEASFERAQSAGINFARMKQAIGITEKKKVADSSDRAAEAQFEALRIKRMREQLDKPVR